MAIPSARSIVWASRFSRLIAVVFTPSLQNAFSGYASASFFTGTFHAQHWLNLVPTKVLRRTLGLRSKVLILFGRPADGQPACVCHLFGQQSEMFREHFQRFRLVPSFEFMNQILFSIAARDVLD